MIRKTVRELVLLHHMRPGQAGEVASFLEPGQPAVRRLMVFGFLPGEKFILERCQPDYLIRFGWTRVAINKRIACGILVQKLARTMINR